MMMVLSLRKPIRTWLFQSWFCKAFRYQCEISIAIFFCTKTIKVSNKTKMVTEWLMEVLHWLLGLFIAILLQISLKLLVTPADWLSVLDTLRSTIKKNDSERQRLVVEVVVSVCQGVTFKYNCSHSHVSHGHTYTGAWCFSSLGRNFKRREERGERREERPGRDKVHAELEQLSCSLWVFSEILPNILKIHKIRTLHFHLLLNFWLSEL